MVCSSLHLVVVLPLAPISLTFGAMGIESESYALLDCVELVGEAFSVRVCDEGDVDIFPGCAT